MPIHLPIPMEPFIDSTETQWEVFFNIQRKAAACYATYTDMMGFFALFSPKRRRAFNTALGAYNEAVDEYRRVMGWLKADNKKAA